MAEQVVLEAISHDQPGALDLAALPQADGANQAPFHQAIHGSLAQPAPCHSFLNPEEFR
jgi:hypothetical protein